jgi:hypothetical protein
VADIQLEEFVLLKCDFSVTTDGEELEDDAAGPSDEPAESSGDDYEPEEFEESFAYPEGDFLQLQSGIVERDEDDEYVLFLVAKIDNESFPFTLSVTTGARFVVPADERGKRPTADEAHGTLIWLSYPYLRETIAGISGRSPFPPYYIPALTRLPDPSAGGKPPEE